MRRLIAILDVLRTFAPGSDLSAIRKRLTKHLRAFSALRDLQVQLLAVRALTSRFPLMQLLRTMLMVREKALLKTAQQEILAIHLEEMERDLENAEQRAMLRYANPLMDEVSRHVVLGVLGKAFARAETLKDAALSGTTDRIHKFRIAFKKFRYTAEALQPFLPGVTKRLLKSMNAYQTRMGEIQDVEVLIATVNAFARHHGPPSPVRSVRLKVFLINKRGRLISRFLAKADEFERFWPTLFQQQKSGT